jgi:hypothetical protein
MTARKALYVDRRDKLPRCYRYVPDPEDADPNRPIERPLQLNDGPNQMTIWDRRLDLDRTLVHWRPEPKSTAIERYRTDVEPPEITEIGCLSDWTEYKCRHCNEFCLAPMDTDRAQYEECIECHRLPSL